MNHVQLIVIVKAISFAQAIFVEMQAAPTKQIVLVLHHSQSVMNHVQLIVIVKAISFAQAIFVEMQAAPTKQIVLVPDQLLQIALHQQIDLSVVTALHQQIHPNLHQLPPQLLGKLHKFHLIIVDKPYPTPEYLLQQFLVSFLASY
jgi:hypothetical protein